MNASNITTALAPGARNPLADLVRANAKRPVRIFLVDDNEDDVILFRHLLAGALPQDPVHLAHAGAIAPALEQLQQAEYDVLFLDYQLGAETGLDLLREVRRRGLDLPVVLLTGHGDEQVAAQAMRCGACDYLSKGKLDVATLQRTLRFALSLQEHQNRLRQAQAELRKREQHFRALVENAFDATVLMNAEGMIQWVSSSSARILGVDASHLLGSNGFDLLNGDNPRLARRLWKDLLRHPGEPLQVAFRHDNGSSRDIEGVGTNWLDDPAVGAVVFNFRDVTARRRAEAAVQAERQRLHNVLEILPVMVCLLTPDHHVRFGNRCFRENFGESGGRRCYEYIFHRSDPCPDCQSFTPFQTHAPHHWEWTAPNGSCYDVHDFPFTDTDGSPLILEMDVNITERRRAEEKLRKLSSAVEQAADAVVMTDCEGAIEYVNPAFEKLTGYCREEVVGQNPRLLKSGSQDGHFYRQMWQTILRGEVYRGVMINRKKSGELYYAEKTITPVLDAAGQITHFISNDRDITERRKLEEQLQQVHKMDAIGQLAGGVAHDFNNLLMVISSYAELMMDALAADSPLRHHGDEILKASRRAAGLTRQLLTFSRKQVQTLRVLDLNSVLPEICKTLQRLIGEDVQFSLQLGQELWPLKADPVQVEQIVMNLATNARDAMPHGGQLRIETRNVELDEAYCRTQPDATPGEHILLAVSDSGTGIDPAILPHIFEPFFTTKEKGKGTGLGLATIYGIVKQSGGHITVHSEVAAGTTFKIFLPRAPATTASAEPAARHAEQLRGRETVLLVEDEDAVRESEREYLGQHGYTVLAAPNGPAALELAASCGREIHLLVTDVVMPGMSGSELGQKLLAQRPGLKVLYVSGYAENTVMQHGLAELGSRFLHKPFTLKALTAKIRELLDAADKSSGGED
ncbi:MAG TPA: PAS domain S-box protein [Terriglobales bacterium]|nr:PAS domain S-box protein [Terriglobales bacterium]